MWNRDELIDRRQRGEGGKGREGGKRERSAGEREEWRLRQCGVERGGVELEFGKRVKFERTEMRLKRVLA